MSEQKNFFLETFGCQMNVVDSERIVELLQELGYRQVEDAEGADLILLNTCSIRDKAERKVYGHLGRYKGLKTANPSLILGVGGCVAQQEGEALLRKLPYLDLVFGTHNVHKLPEMVLKVAQKRERCRETDFLDRETRLRLFPRRPAAAGVARFVTIMQGCDNFCSYCIVPHVRGREISRPATEILGEITVLATAGVREVTLIGQNVNSYGLKGSGEPSFGELLTAVHAIAGIERIRFVTSHPRDLSDDVIAAFGRLDKLCRHLHLPVQSGSDRILAAMNRGYDSAHYLDRVARLKTVAPDIRLTTDIIVGFPGESDADFAATMSLIEKVGFADLYSFLYSPRPGTAAAELVDTTPAVLRQERFDRLLTVQGGISRRLWAADVGRILPVLVEGQSRQGAGQIFGRTVWNRVVNFAGDIGLVGQTIPVRIVRSNRNSQTGTTVEHLVSAA
ncbi:MAG: tRNA (N6-isopentenyl adenosine(37)-C2)-methylthiotransferase MiaB [Desulfuromonadales bacterium GWD2_61_12]|nr:MAG: tRNA (N6-isopentenyl adenosine(37)-C2)-methylthiotransferase MiaB [Desulfuromonadales bacterium GWD2_61_12]